MRSRHLLIAFVIVVVLGIAMHQLLSSLTDTRRIESVRRLESTIEEIQQQFVVIPAPALARPAEVEPAITIDSCDAWEDLFALLAPKWDSHMDNDPVVRFALDVGYNNKDPDALTVDELSSLAAIVHENEALIQRLRDVATQTSVVCHFGGPDHFRQEQYHKCDMWLAVDMFYRYAAGEYALMVRDLIARCKLSRNCFFFGYSAIGVPRCLSGALESGLVEDVLWEELLDELATCRDRADFADDCVYITEDCIRWYEDTPADFTEDHPGESMALFLALGYRYGVTPLRNYHTTWFSDVMGDMLPLTFLPYYQAEPKLEEIRKKHKIILIRDLPWVHRNVGTWVVSILTYHSFRSRAFDEADIDLACVAILLERYRREHGTYPDALEPLAAALGGEFPISPVLGEPYGYLHDGDSYRLWYEYIATGEFPAERRAVVWPGQNEVIGPAA